MNAGLIPVRYATALLGYANDMALTDSVYVEAKRLVVNLSHYRELRNAIDNPVFGKTEKKNILLAAAGEKVSIPFEKLINLLLENNREKLTLSVALRYIDLYREQKNIHSGKLTTASEVDVKTEKRIIELVQKVTGGTLEIEKNIDSSILGGFLLEVDNVRWDASVSGQLRNIRNEYIEQNRKVL
jgi:F-type H+-transporting ATPase subunit delta